MLSLVRRCTMQYFVPNYPIGNILWPLESLALLCPKSATSKEKLWKERNLQCCFPFKMKNSSSFDPDVVFRHSLSKSHSFSFPSPSCFLVWWQLEGSWLVTGTPENQDWWKTPSIGGRQDRWAKLLSWNVCVIPAVSLWCSIVFFTPTTELHVYLSSKSIIVCPLTHCSPSQKPTRLPRWLRLQKRSAPVQPSAILDKSAPYIINAVYTTDWLTDWLIQCDIFIKRINGILLW